MDTDNTHLVSKNLTTGDRSAEQGAGHTPGPWRVVDQHNGPDKTTYRVVCPDKLMPLSDSARSQAELQANARLIAAAPDMLAALKDAELQIKRFAGIIGEVEERDNPWNETLRAIRAALSKTTGAQS